MDRIIPVSELRSNLSAVCRWVEDEHRPVYLTRNGKGRFVLLGIDQFEELSARAGGLPEMPYGSQAADGETPGFMSAQAKAGRKAQVRSSEDASAAAAQATPQPDEVPTQSAAMSTQPDEVPAQPDEDVELSPELKLEEERILRELGIL